MKIGIIGLGSIGRRHVMCLKKLGETNIVALRTKKGNLKDLSDELEYIYEVSNPKEFYSIDFDGVIVSNPTSLHVKTMKRLLEKDIPIFVEKPIASSLEQTYELEKYDTSKTLVGFCLRHHEMIQEVKKFISSGKLGKIYKANLYCGHFLPKWHKYADYRGEYYSRRNLGGGVLRTLSHELDLIHYFFGNVKELCGSVEKTSDLKIDVDDIAYILCRMTNGGLATVELDYLNPIYKRKGIIFGLNGVLEYDFPSKVTFTNYDEKTTVIYNNKHTDDKMYMQQMSHFINMIKRKEKATCRYEDGLYVMKMIQSIEESIKNKSWQNMEAK